MKIDTPFKDLEATWSYLTNCKSARCHDCGHEMLKYVEQQKNNDNVDFGDMASCPKCGCLTFDGVHSDKDLSKYI